MRIGIASGEHDKERPEMVTSTASFIIRTDETPYSQYPSVNKSSGYAAMRGIDRVSKHTPIANTGWKLRFDLGVQLDYTEKTVIATSPWLDDYGVGDSVEDAKLNLLLSLVDLRESLERRDESAQLSDELIEMLSKLRELLESV